MLNRGANRVGRWHLTDQAACDRPRPSRPVSRPLAILSGIVPSCQRRFRARSNIGWARGFPAPLRPRRLVDPRNVYRTSPPMVAWPVPSERV